MRLRSAIAFGVTAASLAPAALGAASAVAADGGLVDQQLCVVTGLLGAQPDASCGDGGAAQTDTTSETENGVQTLQPADQPAADQPAGDQPAVDQPAADQPAADQPAADQPAADQPANVPVAPPSKDIVGDTTDTGQGITPVIAEDAPADTSSDTTTQAVPKPRRQPVATVPQLAQDEVLKADQAPVCGASGDSAEFPVDTKIHGGPTEYNAGGGYKTWYIDMTNTAKESCHNIHPVVVFVDRDRTLKSQQVQMEFFDESTGSWRPIPFTATDEDEHIGVFDDGFPGFVIGAGETLTVKVRLAFTSDTAPNEIVANAAIVQRQGDDGDWVGESNDYRFSILGASGIRPGAGSAELAETGPSSLLGLGATAGAFLLGGGALVVGSRRLRTKGR
ncbi:hypothetical protein [Streptomyces sp. NBC_01465]|uniref:hypothetical protein n=1 Tax=Streptomyces sp. NBC_01465 TaxID=2903878 RepID=UPI002E3768B3|nr:hypothetical protein [Streptomyces sp. NBC_01465]